MKVSFVVRLGLAMAGILMTGAAFAQDPGPGPMGPGPMGPGQMEGQGRVILHRPPIERAFGGIEGRWWNNPRIVEKLKLTDDQRKQFDQILQAHREKLIDLRANLDKADLALEPLVRDDQPNETAILAQIDKVAQARAELEKANARYLLALRGKLTPEQWKQVQEFRNNREVDRRVWRQDRDRGPDGEGRHMGPPPPPPGDEGPVKPGPQDMGPQGTGPQGMPDGDAAPAAQADGSAPAAPSAQE